MMGKIKDKPRNIALRRVLVFIAVAMGFLALEFTYVAIYEDPAIEGSNTFIYENLGRGFMVAYVVLGLLFLAKFGEFWTLISKTRRKELDERQLASRQKVFERSYKLFLILTLAALFFFHHSDHSMVQMLWWFAVVTYLSLPAYVAAWQKDV